MTFSNQLFVLLSCPKLKLITPFTHNDSNYAEATINSMFKFPQGNKLHIQCDVILCKEGCSQPECDSEMIKKAVKTDLENGKEGAIQLLASTTVFVAEPGESLGMIDC